MYSDTMSQHMLIGHCIGHSIQLPIYYRSKMIPAALSIELTIIMFDDDEFFPLYLCKIISHCYSSICNALLIPLTLSTASLSQSEIIQNSITIQPKHNASTPFNFNPFRTAAGLRKHHRQQQKVIIHCLCDYVYYTLYSIQSKSNRHFP